MGANKVYFSIIFFIIYAIIDEIYAPYTYSGGDREAKLNECYRDLIVLLNIETFPPTGSLLVKSAYDCYTYVYQNVGFPVENNEYGYKYITYLYGRINIEEKPITSPRKFCEDTVKGMFLGDGKKKEEEKAFCKRTLEKAGFKHSKGHTALIYALHTKRKFEFKQDENGYPYRYWNKLFNESIIKFKTPSYNPEEWCNSIFPPIYY